MKQWLGVRLHVSWLVAWFCMAIACGIALARVLPLSVAILPGLVIAIPLACIAFLCPVRRMVACIILAGLLCGLLRGDTELAGLAGYRPYLQHTVTAQGVISEDPTAGTSGELRVSLGHIVIDRQRLPGKLWVSVATSSPLRRSDTLVVRGKLRSGFGTYAASMMRPQLVKVAQTSAGDIGLQARSWFTAGIRRLLPDPQASLGAGYLTGERSSLPPDFDAQLKTVGLTHAVVASGYNLTILVALARRLLLSISKYLATLASAGMILGFIAIAGMSPSMSRAGLVTGLSLAAWYYGRTIHPLVLLPFAACCTALWNPSYIWGDVGWYLSFLSFAGVILLAPLIHACIWPKKPAGALRQVIVDTLSAQVATLPIILYTFGQYSPYALLANVAVLPLVPITMACTFLAGLVGCLAPHLMPWLSLPALLLLRYMTAIVGRIAALPGAHGTFFLNTLGLCLCYGVLCAFILALWHKAKYSFRAEQNPSEDGT